jgi:hypothetical protein
MSNVRSLREIQFKDMHTTAQHLMHAAAKSQACSAVAFSGLRARCQGFGSEVSACCPSSRRSARGRARSHIFVVATSKVGASFAVAEHSPRSDHSRRRVPSFVPNPLLKRTCLRQAA